MHTAITTVIKIALSFIDSPFISIWFGKMLVYYIIAWLSVLFNWSVKKYVNYFFVKKGCTEVFPIKIIFES